jgi:hypothetical protein
LARRSQGRSWQAVADARTVEAATVGRKDYECAMTSRSSIPDRLFGLSLPQSVLPRRREPGFSGTQSRDERRRRVRSVDTRGPRPDEDFDRQYALGGLPAVRGHAGAGGMLRAAAAHTRILARQLISAIDQQVPHEQEDQAPRCRPLARPSAGSAGVQCLRWDWPHGPQQVRQHMRRAPYLSLMPSQ